MANIYLRVTRYVADFLRSMGDGQSIPPQQPIRLSPLSEESVVLKTGLLIVPDSQQRRASCYSQSAWNNMLRGRRPSGGEAIIRRNVKDYLSYAEVCTLEGMHNRTKTDAYDFICIQLPTTVVHGGKLIHVCNSHALVQKAAEKLRQMLRQKMIREFMRWDNDNHLFAHSQGIDRSTVEILERFLMEHNISVSHDRKEYLTLRRIMQRWRDEARSMIAQPSISKNLTIKRIDDHEAVIR